MRPKSLILLALALGCGLIASIGISQVMESRGEQAPPEETQLVLVAMTRIDRNTELSAQNVRLDALPVGKVPPNALANLEEIEGRRPSTVIFEGSVLLEPMLGSGEGVRAATQIPEGMRVTTVRVDNTSGAGLIRPGDRVDVQVYARKNPHAGIPEAGTWTILQDVSVFAVDAIISDDENNEALAAKTISLLVSPEQAARVNFGSEIGSIRLVMRGLTDKSEAESFNIGIRELLGLTEKLGEKEDATAGGDSGDGNLADFLDQQQPETQQPEPDFAPQVATTAPEIDKWKMTIFSGLDVRVDRFENGEPIDLGGPASPSVDPPSAVLDPIDLDLDNDDGLDPDGKTDFDADTSDDASFEPTDI